MYTRAVSLPVEVVFVSDPAGRPLSSGKHQVEYSYEAEHQANEDQLPERRYQKPRQKLGWHTEMPWGWEKARKANPVNR